MRKIVNMRYKVFIWNCLSIESAKITANSPFALGTKWIGLAQELFDGRIIPCSIKFEISLFTISSFSRDNLRVFENIGWLLVKIWCVTPCFFFIIFKVAGLVILWNSGKISYYFDVLFTVLKFSEFPDIAHALTSSLF